MLVAIPTFHGRVSPTFDFCRRVTFWRLDEGGFRKIADRRCKPMAPEEKGARLQAMGADLLLCGAIGQTLEMTLKARGIQVISGVAGSVLEVIAAFACGALNEARFQIPGANAKEPILGGAR
jgi:predicted Fe-Mo cluster-binding NifX family protein